MSFTYVVRCDQPDCEKVAEHKIASGWSDSLTAELKTYALVCGECLEKAFRTSQEKQAKCRLAKHETLDPVGVYELVRGKLDRELKRRTDLEEQFNTSRNT